MEYRIRYIRIESEAGENININICYVNNRLDNDGSIQCGILIIGCDFFFNEFFGAH